MKNIVTYLFAVLLAVSCATDGALTGEPSDSFASGASGGSGNAQGSAGVVTAGEWNDLDNWNFWQDLIGQQGFAAFQSQWAVYTTNRVDVLLKSSAGAPVVNAVVSLKQGSTNIWTARTDNYGKAVLWVKPFEAAIITNYSGYTFTINGVTNGSPIKPYAQGVNTITVSSNATVENKIELCFIVDATGSMGDELEFLKSDLQSVINRVQSDRAGYNIALSAVFYRDEGDEYVVRTKAFTQNVTDMVAFIGNQRADGGGDWPEAVHTGLNAAINDLQWSTNARTRIAFLLLDAPPHEDTQVLSQLRTTVKKAAEKGIKIIPITASGIDKSTEYLMRVMDQLTNGTYVFITNDSGVGNDHIEASVGPYQVEFLNDLMVRLIEKYSE